MDQATLVGTNRNDEEVAHGVAVVIVVPSPRTQEPGTSLGCASGDRVGVLDNVFKGSHHGVVGVVGAAQRGVPLLVEHGVAGGSRVALVFPGLTLCIAMQPRLHVVLEARLWQTELDTPHDRPNRYRGSRLRKGTRQRLHSQARHAAVENK